MPPWGREQPDYVRTWQAWFTEAMNASGKKTGQIEQEAAALEPPVKITRQLVSKWRLGENTANVNAVLAIATIFDRNPVEALRAGGYHLLANQIDKLVRDAMLGDRLRRQAQGDDDDRNAV